MSDAFFAPAAAALRGEVTAPPDKSISHRAALFAAMSDGESRIANYLHAEDTTSTLNAVRALGASVDVLASGDVVVRGVGLAGAREPEAAIDVGNAGTLMRLLPGWLAGQEGRAFSLDGDASIRRRPVDRIAEPLERMGALIEPTDGRYPPLRVRGTALSAIAYVLPVASAQVKSCVLIAGLSAHGTTTVTEPQPSRDHTERMLAGAGVALSRSGADVSLSPPAALRAQSLRVPGDLSSAAFVVAAAVLVGGSRVLVRDVGVNWTRIGFLRILGRMGGVVGGALEEVPADGAPIAVADPICDLEVVAGPLRGTTVEAAEVPLAIDELPLVALLGVFAEGETVVRGAAELRVKETDRIAGVVNGLRGLGAMIEATDDGFVVTGTGALRGGVVDACGDHRMAMLGAVAGLASREGVRVVGMEAAAVSYPAFVEDLARLG
ncbi:MAG: 3-phosphoshikimate 1-carboxyvinyltransferase [Solirubrobacteraceae bacterium]|nr:3-phosphoshikimate 1-carboxyvinyltransferase [Solirubrobacteraceae bacterium]